MGVIRWPTLLILCGALALHNGLRIGPVTLVEDLRLRYGIDYAGVGNVIGAYTLRIVALLVLRETRHPGR